MSVFDYQLTIKRHYFRKLLKAAVSLWAWRFAPEILTYYHQRLVEELKYQVACVRERAIFDLTAYDSFEF